MKKIIQASISAPSHGGYKLAAVTEDGELYVKSSNKDEWTNEGWLINESDK